MNNPKYHVIDKFDSHDIRVVTDKIFINEDLDFRDVFNIYTTRIWNTYLTGDKIVRLCNEYDDGKLEVIYFTEIC